MNRELPIKFSLGSCSGFGVKGVRTDACATTVALLSGAKKIISWIEFSKRLKN